MAVDRNISILQRIPAKCRDLLLAVDAMADADAGDQRTAVRGIVLGRFLRRAIGFADDFFAGSRTPTAERRSPPLALSRSIVEDHAHAARILLERLRRIATVNWGGASRRFGRWSIGPLQRLSGDWGHGRRLLHG